MAIFGIVLLLVGIGLIWFRTPLTGTRAGDGDISIYIINHSGETTLLWIGGLLSLLGIGLILVGVATSKPSTAARKQD